jgi:TolB-like protein/class 3 adenylate cyclase
VNPAGGDVSRTQEPHLHLEVGHILFLDIVGYSKLLSDEQKELVQDLNRIVRETEQFRAAEAKHKLTRLPTGDGMVLVFTNNPEAPVECALEISKALQSHPRLKVRMGIHSGPVNPVADVNDQSNLAGAGINVAQRVMSCGDAGHILLSKHFAEDLEHYARWRSNLHEVGTVEAKHGTRIPIVNLYADQLGNSALPAKLRQARAAFRLKSAAVAVLFLVVAVGVAFWMLRRSQEKITNADTAIPSKSIAVLPFENLSADPENAFFTDGVQDEILNNLAKIADLKVISRTSVMQYKTGVKRNVREIANTLGVAHLLEGSVQRVANRVRVSAQLIDAKKDTHLWVERYDRPLDDVFVIQTDIAKAIAAQLQAKLSPEEKAQVEAKLTDNPDAYVVYLRGREFQMRPEVSRDNYVAAEQCYRHAVALDARFALAHARLAEILEGRYGSFDHQPALLAEARSHAEEALRLDPHCGRAHMAMAHILAWSVKSSERDKAIKQEVASALRLVPNDGYLVMIAALFQTDMDWLEEAEVTFQRAIEINPREPKVFYNYFILQAKKGDVAKARWASDRSLELAPESVFFRLGRAIEEFSWTGEIARTKKFLAQIPVGKDPDGRVTAAYCTAAVFERNFPEALRLLAACPSERLPSLDFGLGPMVPKGFLEGWIHFYAGNKERAYTALDSARWILEVEAKENPGDQKAHLHVAMAYAAMGWKDAALAEIARAKDKPDGWQMAALLVHAGERDAALRLLEQLPATEREHAYYDLRLNPHWDPLRSDARFEKIVKEAKQPVALK